MAGEGAVRSSAGDRDAPRRRSAARALLALALLVVAAPGSGGAALAAPGRGSAAPAPKLDVPYEPSAPEVVDRMLALADVRAGDVVYDLGCGDGRIVIAAAKRGARAVGVDLDPQRIREARENARAAGVEEKVELREGDLFETDLGPATVVMLYLWPEVNLRLRPKLLRELRPGTRVVSHAHDMGDWEPQRTAVAGGARVFLWIIPERASR
ncbi:MULTISPECIES: cyclopropane-fatty-acyl-phospholipid synthase family protein [unclassified Anaeromyxobacter]|uniref:SAM-dependent methyltransferase n=1 Tax=unclassified Anaeromyxobacter TaxID=2620896 RepID=UPI001F5A99EE|nr:MULTISPECIES: methyltransferase domain-containing protein [unclassified Anaeromyxobacter]